MKRRYEGTLKAFLGTLSVFLLALGIFVLLLWTCANAGEKEEALLRVQMLQERLRRLDAESQLAQRLFPETLIALEQAKKALEDIEKKAAKPKKD